jgi:hypothetical protein
MSDVVLDEFYDASSVQNELLRVRASVGKGLMGGDIVAPLVMLGAAGSDAVTITKYPKHCSDSQCVNDPDAGTITINEPGLYTINAQVVGVVDGGTRPDSDLILFLDIDGVEFPADAVYIGDRNTNTCALGGVVTREATSAPITLSLKLRAYGSDVTFDIETSTFEVKRVADSNNGAMLL